MILDMIVEVHRPLVHQLQEAGAGHCLGVGADPEVIIHSDRLGVAAQGPPAKCTPPRLLRRVHGDDHARDHQLSHQWLDDGGESAAVSDSVAATVGVAPSVSAVVGG